MNWKFACQLISGWNALEFRQRRSAISADAGICFRQLRFGLQSWSAEAGGGMMKLPNAQGATVPERKIRLYLLNPAHPAGGSKAAFFLRFGFSDADWPRLAAALLRHAQENEVVRKEETRHGIRYVVDGPLIAPDETVLNVRSAWFIDAGGSDPRFVTAHPLPKL